MRREFIDYQYDHERHAEQFIRNASSIANEYHELVIVVWNDTNAALSNFPHTYDILFYECNWEAMQTLVQEDYQKDAESADQTRIGVDIFGNSDWLINQVTKQFDHQAGFLQGYRDTDTGLVSNREHIDDLLNSMIGYPSDHIGVKEYIRRLRYIFVQ